MKGDDLVKFEAFRHAHASRIDKVGEERTCTSVMQHVRQRELISQQLDLHPGQQRAVAGEEIEKVMPRQAEKGAA